MTNLTLDKKTVFNNNYDLFLIKFPIYLPIIYGLCLYIFPEYETELVFFTLLLLAEPHFGATWPFFISKKNYTFIYQKKNYLIFGSFLVLLCSILGYFYVTSLFYLIFLIFNFYHVTKQSTGISKLYLKCELQKKIQENLIYFFGFLFLVISILRFYFNLGLINQNLIFFNFTIIIILFVSISYYVLRFGLSENVLTLTTGLVIFFPVCFVEKPIHAIVMGVTMHYIQYLSLTCKISSLRKYNSENKAFNLASLDKSYFVIIIFYGSIMALLSNTQSFAGDTLKILLVIPLTGQMLHFYIDSFLWKFSHKHNREVTLKYIYNNN
jgi:hypothetical protein